LSLLAINILELQQGWRIRRRFVRQIDADETRTAAASAAHGVTTSISARKRSRRVSFFLSKKIVAMHSGQDPINLLAKMLHSQQQKK